MENFKHQINEHLPDVYPQPKKNEPGPDTDTDGREVPPDEQPAAPAPLVPPEE